MTLWMSHCSIIFFYAAGRKVAYIFYSFPLLEKWPILLRHLNVLQVSQLKEVAPVMCNPVCETVFLCNIWEEK